MRQEDNYSKASKQSAKPSNNSMTSNPQRTVGGAAALKGPSGTHNDQSKY